MKNLITKSLIAMTLIFASCSDDDNTNRLDGRWYLISESAGGTTVNVSECEAKSSITFILDDVTLISMSEEEGVCNTTEIETGTYITKNNKLIISDSNSSNSVNIDYSISGDKLTLTSNDEEVSTSEIYKKE